MKAKWMWVGAGIAVCLAGCRDPSPSAVDGSAMPSTAAVAPRPEGNPATPYARAAQALAEKRMVSPAGDNAVEHYLAARAQPAERTRAQAALSELQPYVLIAAEQALARGDAAEARRLQGLIERIDAVAPALPRLRAGVAALVREQAAQAAVVAMETPPPAVPDMPAAAPVPQAQTGRVAPAVPPDAAPAQPVVAPEPSPSAPPTAPVPDEARIAAVPAAPSRAAPSARLPRLLQDAQPRYPLPALRARIEGQAEVAFTIQPDGSVRDVRVLSSTPAGVFDASSLAVAQRWRFEATGQAHASRRTVRFRLPAEAGDG